jgi:hypothetical protein
MVRETEFEGSPERRLNAYLRRFSAGRGNGRHADDEEETTLDEYLLERAAEELRAARRCLDRIHRDMDTP